MTDSTRILHHLEERFPDPPLFPAEPARAAEVEVFLDWFNRAWKREPNLITDALERGEDGPDVDRWSARLQRRLGVFEGLLTGRDHLFGAFGAADCAAWPFLRYAVAIEPDDDERSTACCTSAWRSATTTRTSPPGSSACPRAHARSPRLPVRVGSRPWRRIPRDAGRGRGRSGG